MSLKLDGVELDFGRQFKLGPITCELSGTACIVGHNGCGKSSLFRLITGLEDASSGEIRWHQSQVYRENLSYRRAVGFLPQPLELPLWTSAKLLLEYITQLRGIEDATVRQRKISSICELWHISSYLNKPLISCSYGMRKRVALSLALINDPALLVLDEPLSGLDVGHIKTVRDVVRQRNEAGQTTILSTHIMSFVAEEAASVFAMDGGQIREITAWHGGYQEKMAKLDEYLAR